MIDGSQDVDEQVYKQFMYILN